MLTSGLGKLEEQNGVDQEKKDDWGYFGDLWK